MKPIYLLTGANGHLGSTLARLLSRRGEDVRGLILPGSAAPPLAHVVYYEGDVRDPASLARLAAWTGERPLVMLHTAGLVDISEKGAPQLWEVNVGGTANVIALCRDRHARLLYVSSVHAIPEKAYRQVIGEVSRFSPDLVRGGYAKSKAAATQLVLDAAAEGLDAVVVHPSGILGPYDESGNHLVQMIREYLRGRLPACVAGGYDFVDVRDVAAGCLAAAERGRRGQCYILSNRHYAVKDVLNMVRAVHGGIRLPVLPLWMARLAEPFLRLDAKRRRMRPLYTSYSLSTLDSNDQFSHDRATRELGYYPRDLFQTVRDTVSWLCSSRSSAKP